MFNNHYPTSASPNTHGSSSADSAELSAILDRMSRAELEQLMHNSDRIKELAKNSAQFKTYVAEKEDILAQNRKLAEENLIFEPAFTSGKQELSKLYTELVQAKSKWDALKSSIDSYNRNADTILALLQTANLETDEKSENLANQFLTKQIDVDTFLSEFLPLRQLFNERRIKIDKLTEKLTAAPVANTQSMPFRSTNQTSAMYPRFPS